MELRTKAVETAKKISEEVTLYGWVNSRRDHGKLIFVDLKDSSGLVQIVFNNKTGPDIFKVALELKRADVIKVKGDVNARLEGTTNPKMETGRVEIQASKVEVLSKAKDLPLDIDSDGLQIEEPLRMKYRYLDLRRDRMQKNLRVRHKVIKFIRDFLDELGFVEVETPILTKTTPEGARDFLVPSRLQKGKFYALPQSPQQYKQLLMVAGFEKYYQIARCFRDEDPRADRAYGEFTQLDLEMSFISQEEILNLTEELFIGITEKVLQKKVLEKPFPRISYAEAIKKYGEDKFDLRKERDQEVLAFAWVLDFPLFEKTKEGGLTSSHHPFTAPYDEDIPLLDKEPLKVRSWQHDLVCNGFEVAGGSIRITDPMVQTKVFEVLGHKEEEIRKKFGHLLEAFEYGVPPHGGIASGIDRFIMSALGEASVRELIAFPASSSGQASVMEAPSEVDNEQLKELGIKTLS